MASISNSIQELKLLDLMGYRNTPLHRLDARAKVTVTFVFIICVVSYGRYELSALFPFFVFPLSMLAISSIPAFFIARKILLLLPFILMAAAFNPLFDSDIILNVGPLAISGGWVSSISILVRSTLTISAALILIGVTGFNAVCQALERLGMPQFFVMQLLFLYRYIFVLTDESERASRARELRSCGKKGLGISSFGALIGNLLLRTWQRADRIHMAMLARGFKGEFHTGHTTCWGTAEIRFVLGWSALFIFLRLENVSQLLGASISRLLT